MKTAAILTALATLAFAGSALADEACTRPTAPAPLDGASATMEQVLAAKNEVAAFMTASDTFQSCVISDLEAKRAAAKAAKTKMDKAVIQAANAQIDENQKDKVAAGAAYNAAVRAFKAAHPS